MSLNPRYDPSRRRRGRNGPRSHHSPFTSLAATAAIAYGAYRLGSLAWSAYCGQDEEDNNNKDHDSENDGEEKEEEDDLLYEWTDDYRHRTAVERDIRREEGFSPSNSDGETDEDTTTPSRKLNNRSRRSRADWSDNSHHEHRSRRPSPPQDYQHHTNIIGGSTANNNNDESESTGDGMMKQGMKLAATGLGSAMTAGITAGIEAYNNKNNHNNQQATASNQGERRLRMGRCRLEASRAMMDFLPTLKKAIAKETDVGSQTAELKELRIQKRDLLLLMAEDNEDEQVTSSVEEEDATIREKEQCLWNDIKNKSMTRLVTTIYAHTIVFLVLTVQVNLLGGRLLRDEDDEQEKQQHSDDDTVLEDGSSSNQQQYRSSHQTVLAKTYHHLFTKGIPSLAKSVGDAVEEILQNWDVLSGDDATLNDVSSWLENVRDKIEKNRQDNKEGIYSSLVQFIIPPEGEEKVDADADAANDATVNDELAKYILDETYDLLESPTFANAERQCLDTTCTQLRTKVLCQLFKMEEEDRSIPLATVVTHLQKVAVSTFHKPPPSQYKEEMMSWGGVLGMMEEPLPSGVPNEYISKLERLDAVMELSDVCF